MGDVDKTGLSAPVLIHIYSILHLNDDALSYCLEREQQKSAGKSFIS